MVLSKATKKGWCRMEKLDIKQNNLGKNLVTEI